MKKALLALLFCLAACAAMAMNTDVTQFGAVADRVTDCTAAFQAAIDACHDGGGGTVRVPSGYYCIKGYLLMKDGVILKGTYEAPPTNQSADSRDMKGSVLMAYAGKNDPDGQAFISLLGTNSGVQGLVIYYPEQKYDAVPPVPYSPCIGGGGGGTNLSVINCSLVNPYVGIKFDGTHRMHISGVQGYPIRTGIFIDQCYDICRIENIHFWPFGTVYSPDDPYCRWINDNGTAFEFGRSDWQYCTNTFCFGYNAGYRFSDKGHDGCNGSFMSIGADCCKYGLLVEQIQSVGIAVTNGEFAGKWYGGDSIPVDILPEVHGKVSLMNCNFWGAIDSCIRNRAPKCTLSATGCSFINWNMANDCSPAVELEAGKAIISDNTFAANTLHVELAEQVQNAVIMGNMADSPFEVWSRIGSRAKIEGNMPEPFVPEPENLVNYEIDFSGEAEGSLLKGFMETEQGGVRWSRPEASINLPVLPDTEYSVDFTLSIPEYAVSEKSGIYYGEKMLFPVKNKLDEGTLSAKIKTGKNQTVLPLTVRVKSWSPAVCMEGSKDKRSLGIKVKQIRMTSNADSPVFSFNTRTEKSSAEKGQSEKEKRKKKI